MYKKLLFICLSLLPILACTSNNNNNNKSVGGDTGDPEHISTVEELTGLLPESLPLHAQALQILPSAPGAEKIGGTRQYINPDNNQTYAKITITEFPQKEEDYDKNWSYNVSFENDQRKVTATQKLQPGVDVYEVKMKDSDMKFTTFFIKKRFEIYIESKGVADIEYHYDIAEPIIEGLKNI